jgi:hypothetical protein
MYISICLYIYSLCIWSPRHSLTKESPSLMIPLIEPHHPNSFPLNRNPATFRFNRYPFPRPLYHVAHHLYSFHYSWPHLLPSLSNWNSSIHGDGSDWTLARFPAVVHGSSGGMPESASLRRASPIVTGTASPRREAVTACPMMMGSMT